MPKRKAGKRGASRGRKRHKNKSASVGPLLSGRLGAKFESKRPRFNEYDGFTVSSSGASTVPRIPYPTSAAEFFKAHVATRRPAVITSLPDSKVWNIGAWTGAGGLEHLAKRAGKCKVWVERRSTAGSFGAGLAKRQMQFEDLIAYLRSGGEDLYLTTQEPGAGGEAGPAMPPASCLAQDFPARPDILRTLVPHRINLWVGRSADGASSGLHHDFHDNLYVLARGRKRFTLFSPADTQHMCTHGTPSRVNRNGLIDYSPRARLRADGAHPAEVARYELAKAEAALAEVEANHPSDDSALAAAEARVEECLEKSLDEEMKDAEQVEGGGESDNHCDGADAAERESGPKHPPSFSRIPNGILREYVDRRHPAPAPYSALNGARPCTVTVSAGEMLYLPAGWFHEVTSFSAPDNGGPHVALNFWFYPPTRNAPEKPYPDGYWASVSP